MKWCTSASSFRLINLMHTWKFRPNQTGVFSTSTTQVCVFKLVQKAGNTLCNFFFLLSQMKDNHCRVDIFGLGSKTLVSVSHCETRFKHGFCHRLATKDILRYNSDSVGNLWRPSDGVTAAVTFVSYPTDGNDTDDVLFLHTDTESCFYRGLPLSLPRHRAICARQTSRLTTLRSMQWSRACCEPCVNGLKQDMGPLNK